MCFYWAALQLLWRRGVFTRREVLLDSTEVELKNARGKYKEENKSYRKKWLKVGKEKDVLIKKPNKEKENADKLSRKVADLENKFKSQGDTIKEFESQPSLVRNERQSLSPLISQGLAQANCANADVPSLPLGNNPDSDSSQDSRETGVGNDHFPYNDFMIKTLYLTYFSLSSLGTLGFIYLWYEKIFSYDPHDPVEAYEEAVDPPYIYK